MEGTDFLAAAAPVAPDARKVLLTAYADTQAAIDAINRVGLDHYLMKPWDPPEDLLYPVLDDLLDAWQASAVIPYDGIRVAGTTWSPRTHAVKDFLARSQIPYRFLDVESDPVAASLVAGVGDGGELPVVFFPDGTTLSAPEPREVAVKAGLRTEPSSRFYDLIVLGAGPAGLAAGLYGASEGLRTAVIERGAVGGQAGASSRIENYLGFPAGVTGSDLARRAAIQAQRLGAELLAATEAIVRQGGALSHHHGIGSDHRAWMEPYLGSSGARWLVALKSALDPGGVMNPGKLVPELSTDASPPATGTEDAHA